MRQPGIEPGPLAWKASILTTGLLALKDRLIIMNLIIFIDYPVRANRTPDQLIYSQSLYHLSYRELPKLIGIGFFLSLKNFLLLLPIINNIKFIVLHARLELATSAL